MSTIFEYVLNIENENDHVSHILFFTGKHQKLKCNIIYSSDCLNNNFENLLISLFDCKDILVFGMLLVTVTAHNKKLSNNSHNFDC